jgi:hypothetical protein
MERIIVECPRSGETERMAELTPREESPGYTTSMIRHTLSFCGTFDIDGRELKRVRTPERRDGLRQVRIIYPKTWREFEELYNSSSVLLDLDEEPVRVKRVGISPRKYFFDGSYFSAEKLDGGESE